MIQMVSLRTFRLATTRGHILLFEAKVPRDVPDDIAALAMAQGCVPTDPNDATFIDDKSRANIDFEGDMRRSVVLLAIEAIVKDGNPKLFGGGGSPKASAISERLGFDVGAKEAGAAWTVYQEAKGQGSDLPVHPKAVDAMRVVSAVDRKDLEELAAEFEVPAEKTEGLDTRALRKLLLAKFHGLVGG